MEALEDLVGTSPAIGALRRKLGRLARVGPGGERPPAMLIHGETGTGKGLVARLIHRSGPRPDGPFVSMNCAAIPPALFEGELSGLLQAAHGGTLYLDEVGLLPESVQARIMAAVNSGAVSVIGGTPTGLARSVRGRRFREDLYRRLAATTLVLPPLRERGRDTLALAERFLDRLSRDHGVPPKRLHRSARAALLEHDWPGNVRELINVLERAVLGSDALVLTADALGLPAHRRASTPSAPVSRSAAIRQHLELALERTGWNIARTAALLGVARNTVYAQIEKYGLGSIAPPSATPRRIRSLERPAPPPDDRLRWERRSLALLAARVESGSGSVAETSAALETLVEKVESFGARVEELTPTRVVAAFGLDGVEDALRRAAHAALAIHNAIERSPRDGKPRPRVEVGLHTALMLVGRRGPRIVIDADSGRAERLVFDRLLGSGPPGETLVSAAAAPLLERRFELAPLADGRGEMFRLRGPERRGLELWGAHTPFVGRRAEMAELQAALSRARGGRGEIVLIGGEAGVGKSRLLWELTRCDAISDWVVLEMRCVPFGRAAAEHPVGSLLRAHFGIERLADAEAARHRVASGLRALDERLESAMPGLCSWLEIPVADAGWQVLEPAERRRAAVAAVTRLMRSQSAARPVLLVVEDLHWADSETGSVLEDLVANLTDARMLVAATRRPGAPHGWESSRATRRLDLHPLPPAEAGRMLRKLVGDDPTLPSTKRLVTEAAEGNPFFLEESVRTLVETGALTGERGRYRAVAPLTRFAVPATVEELLAHRIDRLAPADRRLLQCAAAIGREARLDVLAAVDDEPVAPLPVRVGRLVAAELVREARTADGAVCVFKHALTRETAYASLPDHEKPDLHRRIFAALEALPRREQTDEIERLAHHAFRAGVWDKAVDYLRQAGERAFRRWANGEAEERFSQALAALAHWPDGRARAELGIDLRLSLRDPLWVLGRMDEMRRCLDEARDLAERIGDSRRLGWACCHLARLDWAVAQHPGALANGERGLALAAAIGDPPLAIETRFYVAVVVQAMGECRRAAAMIRENLRALEGDRGNGLPRRFRVQGPVLHRIYLSRCLAELGEFAEAVACAETAAALAEVNGNPFSRVGAQFSLGNAFLREGRPVRAIPLLEAAMALSVEYELQNWRPAVMATLGAAYVATGRPAEGRRVIEEAIRHAEAARILSGHSMWVVYLGVALLGAGRLAEARAQALRARDLARLRGERGFEAWASRLLAEIAARAGERAAALESYREAMAMALALDMRPLAGRCLVEISRVLGDAL